uniref:Uncharacterized protein n=1 Tax=Avena sativa TaxID=4498 RepID=A0ACD5WB25_AVESA
MARYSRALLLPLLLLACALVHSSDGSRSPPGEPQKPEVVISLVVHGASEPRRGGGGTPSTEDGATGHRTGADAASAGVGGGAGSDRGGRAVMPQQVQRRTVSLKLARRVLQGGAMADSAAGSSCRSHDARVTCPPPAGGVALSHVRP